MWGLLCRKLGESGGGHITAATVITPSLQRADPRAAEPKDRLISCQRRPASGVGGQCLFIDLLHVSHKESHKATAHQRHQRGQDHHDDHAPGHVDQEAQAPSDQDLGQLDHAGESGAVQALPAAAAVQGPCLGLLLLQGKHGTACDLHGTHQGRSWQLFCKDPDRKCSSRVATAQPSAVAEGKQLRHINQLGSSTTSRTRVLEFRVIFTCH